MADCPGEKGILTNEESADLLTLAEALGHLVHAVNNHLNSILLQASCLQLKHKEIKDEIDPLRAEVKKAATALLPLQTVRPWGKHTKEALDLTDIVRRVLNANRDNLTGLRVQWPSPPSQARGAVGAVERLVLLLMRIGQRAAANPVLTFLSEGLVLSLPGISPMVGEANRLELPPETDPGVPSLERAAASWLARQMGAALTVETTPNGAALVLAWSNS